MQRQFQKCLQTHQFEIQSKKNQIPYTFMSEGKYVRFGAFSDFEGTFKRELISPYSSRAVQNYPIVVHIDLSTYNSKG